MDRKYWDSQEVFRNESKVVPFWLNRNEGEEEQNCTATGIAALELRLAFQRMMDMLPLILDTDWLNHRQICGRKSCPCGNKFSVPVITPPSKNLTHQCTESAEFMLAESLSLLCRAASLFDTPVNLRLSKFFPEDINCCRRTRYVNDLGKFSLEYNSAAALGNMPISPLGQWILDTVDGSIKASAYLRSSLVIQLGPLDGSCVTMRPLSNKQIALSEVSCSPSEDNNTLLEEAQYEVTPTGKQRSELNISDNMLVSCTNTKSTCSIQSVPINLSLVTKGLLRVDWKDGIPIFLFRVHDDRGDLYLASRQKIESSTDKELDYMYLFHSRTSSRKDSRSHSKSASNFVGKMKVSSSLVLNSNRSKLIETEYVLFGASKKDSGEKQSPLSTATKSKGLSKILAEAFKPSYTSKRKSLLKTAGPTSQTENFLHDPSLFDFCNYTETASLNKLEVNSPPNLELAAIVVKDYQKDLKKEVAVGGWGLKFLEKARSNDVGTPVQSLVSSETCEETCSGNPMETSRSVNVIIPAGFHGGPSTSSGGPSRLVERWKTHGQCDCGGWDIGCPLTLLKHMSSSSDSSPQDESQQDINSVYFFMEGSKRAEPALRIANMTEGLYHIYFQSNLSALQSFFIGVAMLHIQTPGLYPKL